MLEPPNEIGNKQQIKDSYSKSSLMCAGEDLNLHAFRHYHLKVACLPISAPAQVPYCNALSRQRKDVYSLTSAAASTAASPSIDSGAATTVVVPEDVCITRERRSMRRASRA